MCCNVPCSTMLYSLGGNGANSVSRADADAAAPLIKSALCQRWSQCYCYSEKWCYCYCSCYSKRWCSVVVLLASSCSAFVHLLHSTISLFCFKRCFMHFYFALLKAILYYQLCYVAVATAAGNIMASTDRHALLFDTSIPSLILCTPSVLHPLSIFLSLCLPSPPTPPQGCSE